MKHSIGTLIAITLVCAGLQPRAQAPPLEQALPEEEKERTLILSFEQRSEFGNGTDMVLKVESPFDGVLKYRLGMILPSDQGFRKTSACPVLQGVLPPGARRTVHPERQHLTNCRC